MSTPSDRKRSQAHQPPLFALPADPPAETQPATELRGRPRLRAANREHIVFRAAPLDALISHDHPARLVWGDVEGLDLRHRDELCREHVAFPWLAGDGSTNYHARADFRTDHVARLNDLLTKSVATLMAAGLVEWNRGAQDGMRVRARAGAASSR